MEFLRVSASARLVWRYLLIALVALLALSPRMFTGGVSQI